MRIIVTNDDGFDAKGIKVLAGILRAFGDLTIVAPKKPQSGMSMAITMGYKPIAVRKISEQPGESWWYLDGTPASCVKFAQDNILLPIQADLVVSGINHGSNAATASIYSGTIGAAMEGAVNSIPSIGVSLDSFDPDADFSAIEELLPGILDKLISKMEKGKGVFYNINFPALPASRIRGVKICHMAMAHWEKEYVDFNEFLELKGRRATEEDLRYIAQAHPDEQIYVMAGDCIPHPQNRQDSDMVALKEGWITITPQNIDNTDFKEIDRLCGTI